MTEPEPVRVLVRLLPAHWVGESQRVVHIVPIMDVVNIPDVLVGYCGTAIGRGTCEQLLKLVGMPCELCFMTVPIPQHKPIE